MIRIGSSRKLQLDNSDIKPVINNEVGKVVQQAVKLKEHPFLKMQLKII